MNPLFHPQLVNGPWGDPVLYIEFKHDRRAILFDLGDVRLLPSRNLLKVTHVFVSHTHLDHFIGFDHLLRVCLGREKTLFFYGPPQFIDQAGRLARQAGVKRMVPIHFSPKYSRNPEILEQEALDAFLGRF